MWPLQTGWCLLLKLAVTNSNSSILVAETFSNKSKRVLNGSTWQDNRRWLWTSSNWFMLHLLKLAVTSSNWIMLVAETGSNKPKPVLNGSTWQVKRRWLWLVQTGLCWLLKLDVTSWHWSNAYCWNWLWPVQTGSCLLLKLAVKSWNWSQTLLLKPGCD